MLFIQKFCTKTVGHYCSVADKTNHVNVMYVLCSKTGINRGLMKQKTIVYNKLNLSFALLSPCSRLMRSMLMECKCSEIAIATRPILFT